MRIAIAQMNPVVGDFEKNITAALECARLAHRDGAEFIVYPSFALTGPGLGGLLDSEAFCIRAQACADVFARNIELPAVVGSALWDPAGQGRGLPMPFLCQEGQAFPLNADAGVVPAFELEGLTFTVFQEGLAAFASGSATPDVVIDLTPTAYRGADTLPLVETSLSATRQTITSARSWLLRANLVGGQDDLVYPGGSFVMSPEGVLTVCASLFSTNLLIADIVTGQVPDVVTPDVPGEVALDYEALVLAVHDYCGKNGFSEVLIGLSGGIDSALVAALATDALGRGHVHGVMMPSRYSSEGSITDAKALAKNLDIEIEKISVKKPLEAFDIALKDACDGKLEGLALENTQARIRTVYLMALSNTYGWILLNTGNKSEAAMGFSTLYGDTAGAFAPLGDVYKTRVYELARWRNMQGNVIPREILVKAPSAELYEGQKDSDRLPEYDELDKVLEQHVEKGKGLVDLTAAGLNHGLCDDTLRTISAAEFKRRQEPLAPQISSRSFVERAWPVTNSFADR